MNLRTAGPSILAASLIALTVAACGASAPPIATTASTATPSPSAPAATVAPTATHADDGAAAAALAAFADLIEHEDLSFHLAQDVGMNVDGAPTLDATYDLDVNGREFAGSIQAAGQSIDLVYVGGTGYSRAGGGKWVTSPMDDGTVAEIVAPWRYLGPLEDLKFLTKDPPALENFQFVNTSAIPYQTASLRAQGIEGTIDNLELVLAPDGKPVSFWLHAIARPTAGPLAGKTVDMLSSFAVDHVGEPITIEKPE